MPHLFTPLDKHYTCSDFPGMIFRTGTRENALMLAESPLILDDFLRPYLLQIIFHQKTLEIQNVGGKKKFEATRIFNGKHDRSCEV